MATKGAKDRINELIKDKTLKRWACAVTAMAALIGAMMALIAGEGIASAVIGALIWGVIGWWFRWQVVGTFYALLSPEGRKLNKEMRAEAESEKEAKKKARRERWRAIRISDKKRSDIAAWTGYYYDFGHHGGSGDGGDCGSGGGC